MPAIREKLLGGRPRSGRPHAGAIRPLHRQRNRQVVEGRERRRGKSGI